MSHQNKPTVSFGPEELKARDERLRVYLPARQGWLPQFAMRLLQVACALLTIANLFLWGNGAYKRFYHPDPPKAGKTSVTISPPQGKTAVDPPTATEKSPPKMEGVPVWEIPTEAIPTPPPPVEIVAGPKKTCDKKSKGNGPCVCDDRFALEEDPEDKVFFMDAETVRDPLKEARNASFEGPQEPLTSGGPKPAPTRVGNAQPPPKPRQVVAAHITLEEE